MNIIKQIKQAQATLDALIAKAIVVRVPVQGSDTDITFKGGVVLDYDYEFDCDCDGATHTVFTVAFETEEEAKEAQAKFAS